MSATAQDGASINEDMCIIRNGSKTGYGTDYVFNGVDSNVFTFSAEDSKGRIGQRTITTDMVDYFKPTCNVVERRPDALGNINLVCYGDYFNGSFGAKDNKLIVYYQYGVGWERSDPVAMNVSITGNSYVATASLTVDDYKETYNFHFTAGDELCSVGVSSLNITSVPVFHWGKDDFVFEVPVTFKQGTTGVTIPTDDEDSVEVKTGVWSPTLNGGYPSYTVRSGWYTKSGNIVTVGFYLKADCSPGDEALNVTVGGLPFTPAIASAGGGMCSGTLIQGNNTFQCFVAETDGAITTRVQACDNTSGATLSTSASGCKYPSGGTLTLSGTITYMTNFT
jgi:hypothetical protein